MTKINDKINYSLIFFYFIINMSPHYFGRQHSAWDSDKASFNNTPMTHQQYQAYLQQQQQHQQQPAIMLPMNVPLNFPLNVQQQRPVRPPPPPKRVIRKDLPQKIIRKILKFIDKNDLCELNTNEATNILINKFPKIRRPILRRCLVHRIMNDDENEVDDDDFINEISFLFH